MTEKTTDSDWLYIICSGPFSEATHPLFAEPDYSYISHSTFEHILYSNALGYKQLIPIINHVKLASNDSYGTNKEKEWFVQWCNHDRYNIRINALRSFELQSKKLSHVHNHVFIYSDAPLRFKFNMSRHQCNRTKYRLSSSADNINEMRVI